MSNDWPIPMTGEDIIGQMSRRLAQQARRPSPVSATELLGPGISARSVEVLNWNSEETTFNGFFYSNNGALNAPGPGRWVGVVIAQDDSNGVQMLWSGQPTAAEPPEPGPAVGEVPQPTEVDPEPEPVILQQAPPARSYLRYYSTTAEGLPAFTPWQSAGSGFGGQLRDLDDVTQFDVTPDKSLLMWSEIEQQWLPHAYVPGLNAVAVTAQQALGDAEAAMNFAKAVTKTFIQPEPPVPTAEEPIPPDSVWYDSDDSNTAYYWADPQGDGTFEWVNLSDAIIAGAEAAAAQAAADAQAALTAAADAQQEASDAALAAGAAQAAADAAQAEAEVAIITANSAVADENYVLNPFFDDWPSGNALPTSWANASTVNPSRETAIVRTAPASARFNVTAGTNRYLVQSLTTLGNPEYVTFTVDVYLVSGDLSGSGVLVRWINTASANFDAPVSFSAEIPNAVTGRWYQVTKTVKRPSNFTGTFSKIDLYPMGGWINNFGTVTAKDIVFDGIRLRPASTAEILAFNATTQADFIALQQASPNLLLDSSHEGYSGAPTIVTTAGVGQITYTTPAMVHGTRNLRVTRLAAGDVFGVTPFNIPSALVNGKQVTVSFTARANAAYSITPIQIQQSGGTINGPTIALSATAQRYSYTVTLPSNLTGDWRIVYRTGPTVGDWTEYDAVQVQVGAVASPWGPSPQDAAIAAASVQTFAESKNKVWRRSTEPPLTGNATGDAWFHTGQGNRLYQWDGSIWASQEFTSGAIGANAIDSKHTVTGALIQTEATLNRGLKFTSGGMTLYNASGVATLTLTASNGDIATTGSIMTGGELNGAIVTGGTVQTETTANRGVKISSTGLAAYNSSGVATFNIAAATGAVTGSGAFTGGSFTGGTVQTEATANRGIKITSTGMVGYDSAGVAKFTLTAAGALTLAGGVLTDGTVTGGTIQTESTASRGIKITSGGLIGYDSAGAIKFSLTTTGALSLDGPVTTGGSVTGATVTGGTVQTESTAARGVKITSTGLVGYNSSGAAVFSLSNTGALSLTGTINTGSSITGATVTGGTIQSESTAARGVKITSTGLVAYDTAGTAVTTLGTNGIITTGSISISGGSISGATTITGVTLQTESSASRGIKIASTGLTAYDSAGSPTLTITASTGALALAGTLTGGGRIEGPSFKSTSSGDEVWITGGTIYFKGPTQDVYGQFNPGSSSNGNLAIFPPYPASASANGGIEIHHNYRGARGALITDYNCDLYLGVEPGTISTFGSADIYARSAYFSGNISMEGNWINAVAQINNGTSRDIRFGMVDGSLNMQGATNIGGRIGHAISDIFVIFKQGSVMLGNAALVPTSVSGGAGANYSSIYLYQVLHRVAAATMSDMRTKKDLADLGPATQKIKALKAKRFKVIDDRADAPEQIGFVAQEVQEVVPEAVQLMDDESDFLGVKHDVIYTMNVKATQELIERVEALETRLNGPKRG